MEEKFFPLPEVSGALRDRVVEARLHADDTSSPFIDRIHELQQHYTGSIALPIYVVVDPANGEVLGKQEGLVEPGEFVRFLEQATGS